MHFQLFIIVEIIDPFKCIIIDSWQTAIFAEDPVQLLAKFARGKVLQRLE